VKKTATKESETKNGVPPADRRKSSAVPAALRQASRSESGQADLVGGPAEPARSKPANVLCKLFVEQVSTARKGGSFTLPQGETEESFGTKLGIAVEQAMYQNLCGGSGSPNQQYSDQLRTILHNVKSNPALRDKLLVGSLSPSALSTMSTADMATKELKQMTAQMKKEADKQAVLVQETGPRIRRTHKGEEVVGEENQHVSEPIFPTNKPRRRESVIDDDAHRATSPGAMSPRSPIIPDGDDSHARPKPHAIDTKAPPRPGASAERKSSSNFNIQDVWSSVPSPDTEKHPTSRQPSTSFREPPSSANVQPDAEIDQLLKDEDNESEPYSPKEFSEEGVIWHGKIVMKPQAEFSGFAKFAGGADLNNQMHWNQLLPSTLHIDGRIQIERASSYLCGLRYSSTTDISVVSISAPDNEKDREQFNNLFTYFQDRKRYGVVSKHPVPAVKDTYVIPVEVGEGTKPEFLSLLQNNQIDDPNLERKLLLAFVIKKQDANSASATPRQPESAVQPIGSPTSAVRGTPTMPQHALFSPHLGYNGQNSPSQPPTYGSPNQRQLPFSPPMPNYPTQQDDTPAASLTGAAAAQRVLGPLAKSAAVQQLLIDAPFTSIPEFNVVRDVLINVPAAANDLSILVNVLKAKTQGG
jgi:hypothetical protein